jgi:hypothetical protein
VASSTALLVPNIAPAASFKITDLMRLHPVRFIVGLIFSIARSVVVKIASDYLVTRLRQQVITGSTANLTRRTICFSKQEYIHDIVSGLYINQEEFGGDIHAKQQI